MISKKDLEETIKEKVAPLVDEIMEKSLGLHIPKVKQDISDKLANPLANIYVPAHLSFTKAKKQFKKEFLKKELALHLGNISQLAKSLDINRRSIHRSIKELGIKLSKLAADYQEQMVSLSLKETFDSYRNIFRAEKIEQMYDAVPALSRNIAKVLPHPDFTWKEIEQEFEKQFLDQALKTNHWQITDTAKKIEIRVETLHRKIKKLGLRK